MWRIVRFLRDQGVKVWVDNEKLIPGTPIWEEEIEIAIKSASAVVVVLSPDAKSSEWVRREISLADQNRKRIFPVLVRGDEDSSITLRLITRQHVDLRENEDAGLNSLHEAITRFLTYLQKQLDEQAREEAEKLASEIREKEEKEREKTGLEEQRKAKEEAFQVAPQIKEVNSLLKAKAESEPRKKATFEKVNREAVEGAATGKSIRQRWLINGAIGAIIILLFYFITKFSPAAFEAAGTKTATRMPATEAIKTSVYTPSSNTKTATPQLTLTSSISTPGDTCDKYAFIKDVTIPDNTVMSPGQSFIKTWRVKNIGFCTWDNGYKLIFSYGDTLECEAQPLSIRTGPGQEADFSTQCTAPNLPGTYTSYWTLFNTRGISFQGIENKVLYVQIIVK